MQVPPTWVSEWFGYWSSISEKSLEQWRTINDEVSRREFGPAQLMSESIEFWNTAFVGWWSMFPDPTQLLPTLFINLDGGDAGPATVTRTVPIYRLRVPTGSPKWAYLRPIEHGNRDEINVQTCRLRWSAYGNELVVELFGPHAEKTAEAAIERGVEGFTKPVPLTPGVYQGLVYVGAVPLATVIIRVGHE